VGVVAHAVEFGPQAVEEPHRIAGSLDDTEPVARSSGARSNIARYSAADREVTSTTV
jgi:hypothetical protein